MVLTYILDGKILHNTNPPTSQKPSMNHTCISSNRMIDNLAI